MTNFDKVAKILADYKDIDVATITPESEFSQLGFDSLDVVELIMSLEDEFGVSIEMSEEIKSVGDITKVIDAKKGE